MLPPEYTVVAHQVIAVLVTVAIFVAIQVWRGAPSDLLFLGGLLLVTLTGVITPERALAGFANPALLTIGGLLVVAAGLRSTGVLDWIGHRLLGSVHTESGALWRLAVTMIAASAFLLNTAIVAMMAPVVVEWCRRRHVSPSRMLIPLSYLAILGGVCTLIGTSTTLVVNGLLRKGDFQKSVAVAELEPGADADQAPPLSAEERARRARFNQATEAMGLLEIGYVGLPCALVGVVYLLTVGPRLLPDRTDLVEQLGDARREYLVEMLVQAECRLIGHSIEEAGLRHLPGLYLIEIDRDGDVITPVTPRDTIHAGDRLVFTGVVSTIVDLEKIPGLVPAADSQYEFHPRARQQRHLTEVVLSRTSPLIGTTVKDANFRQRYNAAVVAVHRNGVRLTNKIGNIPLEPGDTLLLQTRTEFVSSYRNSRDFYLVSPVEGAEPRRHDRAGLAAGLLGLLIVWLCATNWLRTMGVLPGLASPAVAALGVAGLMILTRCLRLSDARSAIDLQLLVTIACALGLGTALFDSGAAERISMALVAAVGTNPTLLLIVIFLLTMLLTEMITNNAVAAILLPIAIGVAWQAGYNPRPFIIAITLAASLSFVTPMGYQTNLMVMGPGGYKPFDYVRVGLPLAILIAATAIPLIHVFFPFTL